MRGFLKWAGGKKELVPHLAAYVPAKLRTYVEPFAGGAALFFALREHGVQFERAVLCDVNADLITCYTAVRDHVGDLIEALQGYRYDRELFYSVRAIDASTLSTVDRAARTIFLNRTCYNGLWRVNSRGQFNVPFGRYTDPKICNEPALRSASAQLQGVDLVLGDFASVTRSLGARDFAYFDPPYVPVSRSASFTAYTKAGFGPAEQTRLVKEFARLSQKGVRAVLSNADTSGTRDLYTDFSYTSVGVRRAINASADKRGKTPELIVLTAALVPERPASATRRQALKPKRASRTRALA